MIAAGSQQLSRPTDNATARWADATQALVLFAIDPIGLGGANLHASPGPVRDLWLQLFRARVPAHMPVRRVPANVTEQRLLGGLDLAATLNAGRAIAERGLLPEANGGVLVLAMAERVAPSAAAHIATALDTKTIRLERDGLAATLAARFAVIALDEGLSDDERVASKLLDRMAFHLELSNIALSDTTDPIPDAAQVQAARSNLASITVPDQMIEAITSTALALGISSLRAVLFAVTAARAAAAFAGRSSVDPEDATLAASLVLGPRATQLPQPAPDQPDDAEPEPPEQEQQPPEPPEPPTSENSAADDAPPDDTPQPVPTAEQLADRLLQAAVASIPAGLLAQLQHADALLNRARTHGRAGMERLASGGGRPAGCRRGDPRRGGRLNVIETLRAAAPWQTLRRHEIAALSAEAPQTLSTRRIEVRKSDFHINRTKQKSETVTIFVVDASGSSALNRLAEAKGAVELLLADCYVRRDQVAVLAFRGTTTDLLLPPTRSLVRAKRCLAGLPGGGPTPLATAIDAAAVLADSVRRKGQTPTLIFMTDGRGNIARDGKPGRQAAAMDAVTSARALRALRITALWIDTSPKPQPQGEQLAAQMQALYLPLPYADATRVSKAVRAVLNQTA